VVRLRQAAPLVVGALGVLGLAVALAAGPLSAWTVARSGRAVLDVPVRVAAAWPAWPPLAVSLRGVVVPNPPGFRAEPALWIGHIRVRVSPQGLLGDPLVVEEIAVSDVLVRVDALDGRTNLQALHQRARRAAGGDTGRRLLIRRFRVSRARATAAAPGIGGPRVTVPIKDFELRELGGPRGATHAQLADTVLKLVEPSVANALRRADPAGAFGAAVGKAAEKIKGLFH
jgi:hypothetical protein